MAEGGEGFGGEGELIEIGKYSLQHLSRWREVLEHRRSLLCHGEPTPITVNGDQISFQFSCGASTLLATNYDYFEGVSHWIYLLGAHGEQLDAVTLPDSFGYCEEINVITDDKLSFCTFGSFGTNHNWSVGVDEKGYWSFAPHDLRIRLNRFFFAKRRLRVHKETTRQSTSPSTPRGQ